MFPMNSTGLHNALRTATHKLILQIRASVLRCLHVIFSADPIRATLAHGQVSEFLQAQAKAYTQAGSSAVVGMLEVLALHAYMCGFSPCCVESCEHTPQRLVCR